MSSEEFRKEHKEIPMHVQPEVPSGGPPLASWWVGGWSTPIIVILFTIIWSLGIYWLIGNRERDWQYGVAPYIPAQSFLTTRAFSNQSQQQVVYPSTVRRIANVR